jgi:hypothetical protein
MINKIIRYFDLQSEQRSVAAKGVSAETRKYAPVIPQYGAVAAGVLADPLLRNFMQSGGSNFSWSGFFARAGFALLMAIALLPAVYKNAFDPEKPILVQLCALFTSGVGWQSLFQAATSALVQSAPPSP